MPAVLLKTDHAAESVEVSLERTGAGGDETYAARIGAKKFAVVIESTGEGAGWMQLNGRRMPFHVVRANGTVHVWVSGRTYRLDLIERTARRTRDGTAAARRSDLTAPMPGTVLKVLVKVGQQFEAHAPLVVMESMKMEITLSAPHAGRVKEVACRPGQLVAMSAVLMRFDEKDDGSATP